MKRVDVIKKVKDRKESIGLTIDNIAKLTNLGNRTVARFFAGEDVKLSTLEKITEALGLDFAGEEVLDIDTLREKRAKKKALYIVSLVQDTSSLEKQGLNNKELELLIKDTQMQFLTGEYQKHLWAN